MDDADRAEDRLEQVVADGIQAAKDAVGLKPTGACYYCNETMMIPRLFCCPDCAQDWEWLQGNKGRNGKVL